MYFYFFNHTNTKIFMYNNANHTIKISMHQQFGFIIKLLYKSCFTILINLNRISIPSISAIIFYNCNSISIL